MMKRTTSVYSVLLLSTSILIGSESALSGAASARAEDSEQTRQLAFEEFLANKHESALRKLVNKGPKPGSASSSADNPVSPTVENSSRSNSPLPVEVGAEVVKRLWNVFQQGVNLGRSDQFQVDMRNDKSSVVHRGREYAMKTPHFECICKDAAQAGVQVGHVQRPESKFGEFSPFVFSGYTKDDQRVNFGANFGEICKLPAALDGEQNFAHMLAAMMAMDHLRSELSTGRQQPRPTAGQVPSECNPS